MAHDISLRKYRCDLDALAWLGEDVVLPALVDVGEVGVADHSSIAFKSSSELIIVIGTPDSVSP